MMGSGRPCLRNSDTEFLTITPFLPQDDLKSRLAEFDLFVFPTLVEGCARSGMEALAAGLPVVTTANCGLPAVHGNTAFYVPLGSAESLAEAIEELAENDYLREKIGRAGAALISQHYTWDHYGRNVFNLFQNIIDRTTRAPLASRSLTC
jgi:glycosyltransferase involved in cell wall biosynthesis